MWMLSINSFRLFKNSSVNLSLIKSWMNLSLSKSSAFGLWSATGWQLLKFQQIKFLKNPKKESSESVVNSNLPFLNKRHKMFGAIRQQTVVKLWVRRQKVNDRKQIIFFDLQIDRIFAVLHLKLEKAIRKKVWKKNGKRRNHWSK